MAIKDKAMIAHLKISIWTARKDDKTATAFVEHHYNAQGNSGNFKKNLIFSSYLEELNTISSNARAYFHNNTLPWFNDGSRILPTAKYFDFLQTIDDYQSKFMQKARDFIKIYSGLKTEAKTRLGDLYKDEDYPTEGELAKKFAFKVILTPFPDVKDFRINLNEEEIENIQDTLRDQLQLAQEKATKDLFNRLHKAVDRMVERLSDSNNKFKNSLVGNLQELCNILPALNVNDDPDLNAMILEIKTKLIKDPEELRSDLFVRQQTADDAQDIVNKLRAYTNL